MWSEQTRRRFLTGTFCVPVSLRLVCAQDETTEPDQANFFSGTVTETTPEKIAVSRTVLGQPPETRSFQITSETTVEGKLQSNARVTVRFRPGDNGDVAVHIIVRTTDGRKKR